MSDNAEIMQRLAALERENQELRHAIAGAQPKPKQTTTHIAMFKGRPVITFNGEFRPFSFGLRKATVILEKVDDVIHFVDNNKKYLDTPLADEDSPTA